MLESELDEDLKISSSSVPPFRPASTSNSNDVDACRSELSQDELRLHHRASHWSHWPHTQHKCILGHSEEHRGHNLMVWWVTASKLFLWIWCMVMRDPNKPFPSWQMRLKRCTFHFSHEHYFIYALGKHDTWHWHSTLVEIINLTLQAFLKLNWSCFPKLPPAALRGIDHAVQSQEDKNTIRELK